MSEDELARLRADIDRLDREVLDRLNQRAQCAQRIGEVKRGPIYRPEREALVLRKIAELNPGPLSGEAVQRIFREIMSWCLALEHPLKVAFLGPAGTFSESAARKHFGGAPDFLPQATIDEVFHAVEAGGVAYGIVPVENSTEGAVGRTLDLLLASSSAICGEVKLRVRQHFLTRAASVGEVKKIYSHSQSLAQCQDWIARHAPGVPQVAVASNAEAARLASEDASCAAIAGEAAGNLYELNFLASDIEDDPNNTTRFLVIGSHDAGSTGRDKTSLVCSAPNRPGAVFNLLEAFARHGVSMSKLESRPSRTGLWEYVFYIDVEGNRHDEPVMKALADLQDRAAFVKVLGSYPVASL
ncbi:prephenate dehydratase [Niveibacterium terrae]|uniref:prephenate dehydratase n=1 Tax=Niveibacterium terrae TaxID=3373598 RepID=UPI003A8D45E2